MYVFCYEDCDSPEKFYRYSTELTFESVKAFLLQTKPFKNNLLLENGYRFLDYLDCCNPDSEDFYYYNEPNDVFRQFLKLEDDNCTNHFFYVLQVDHI